MKEVLNELCCKLSVRQIKKWNCTYNNIIRIKNLGELENDGLNIKNFYRMICFCLNTDILVDNKLKYYNNIMDSVKLNDYDELTEDIFTIGNCLNIIMDLDAFQIQVLKLVYQNIGRIDVDLISREIKKSKLNGMNKNDIKIIIRKLYINRDIGITSENFHKYYVVMCL